MSVTLSTSKFNTQKAGAAVSGPAGTTADAQLTRGSCYRGIISSVNPSGRSYTVRLELGPSLPDCELAIGPISAMLGVKISWSPPLGTPVLVSYGATNWIIAFGRAAKIWPSVSHRSASGEEEANVEGKLDEANDPPQRRGHDIPNDLLEGEFEIANGLGGALQLLTHITKLQGSERARIEMHAINDMVRIFSGAFQHISAFGDQNIYEDGGKINVRFNGTSYEHEAYGQKNVKDPKGKVEKFAIQADSVAETGRWRMAGFVGFLGDFLHTFFTEPEDVVGSLAQKMVGKARVHVNSDGGILMQSVHECVMEKVTRIAVPVELKAHHDPEGATARDYKDLEKKFLKIWDGGKNNKDLPLCAFQLREYARWLSEYHSYARFHQLPKDWDVPAHSEAKEPTMGGGEEDRIGAVNNAKHRFVYSTRRIMPDGGILDYDAYGNSINMGRHGVHVSSYADMDFEAAGTIRMRAGRDILIAARRHLELIAIVGGWYAKGRTALKALCEWGSIHLKSDVDMDDLKTSADQPDPADPAPRVLDYAIQIDAPSSNVLVSGRDEVRVTSEKKSILIQSLEGRVHVEGREGVNVTADKGDVGIYSGADGEDGKGGTIALQARHAVLHYTDLFDINQGFTYRRHIDKHSHVISMVDVRAQKVSSAGIFGGRVGPTPVSLGQTDFGRPHYNHVREIGDDVDHAPRLAEPEDVTKLDTIRVTQREAKPTNTPFTQAYAWELPKQNVYVRKQGVDQPYQTLSQQLLSTTPDDALKAAYGDMPVADMTIKKAKRTADGTPMYGGHTTHWTHEPEDCPALNDINSRKPSEMNSNSRPQQRPLVFKYLKAK